MVICASGVLASTTVATAAPMVPQAIDEVGTAEVGIPVCSAPSDIDCLESVVIVRRGVRIPARLLQESAWGMSQWTYTSPTQGNVELSVLSRLMPLGVIQSWGGQVPGARIQVDRKPDWQHPSHGPEGIDCSTGVVEDCTVAGPAMPPDEAVEVALRMSWLRPLNVAVHGHDVSYRQETIPGGHKFVLSAEENLSAIVTSPPGTPMNKLTSDYWMPDLYFIIDHAGTSTADSAYDPRCASHGAPVTAHNASWAGQPYWNPGDQSFNFGIQSAHYAPSGSLYEGTFEAKFPVAWLRCQASLAHLSLNGFIVQVLNENGEEQAATTVFRQRKGQVTVRAAGFHFSSPTIKLARPK